jgi:hypothetical protein
MNAYQVIRAAEAGKRIFRGVKEINGEEVVKYIWAFSIENAQGKLLGFTISEWANLLISYGLPRKEN